MLKYFLEPDYKLKSWEMMLTRQDEYMAQIANVSPIRRLQQFIKEYPNQQLVPQFQKLQKEYPYYQAVRGDGNCFYRAIAFLYLRQADFNQFSIVFRNVKNVCVNYPLQFEGQTFQQTLQKLYQQYLAPIRNTSPYQRQNQLTKCFNKNIVFDVSMILYLRSLNYQHIKKHERKFINFCSRQAIESIKVFGRDSEGIQYLAMAEALDVAISVKIISDERTFKYQIYNEKNSSCKHFDLFFRPGHFDILYHKESYYLKFRDDGKKNSFKIFYQENQQENELTDRKFGSNSKKFKSFSQNQNQIKQSNKIQKSINQAQIPKNKNKIVPTIPDLRQGKKELQKNIPIDSNRKTANPNSQIDSIPSLNKTPKKTQNIKEKNLNQKNTQIWSSGKLSEIFVILLFMTGLAFLAYKL